MTKIMNNNKVCIISFLICHIYSVNVNDERRKVMNLELIKNNIIFRLITKKEFDRLTKQLEATKDEFPYRKWNDLYLIYRSILPNQSEDLVTTMLISNFIMKRLKFTEEELFQFAKTNTAKRTGIIVTPLSNPFRNEMSAKTDIWNFSDDTSDSTILSNRNLMNGAALILCDEVMDKVVEHYKVNVLYILPSSIHEVIIIPDSDSVDVEYLKNMVYEINRSTVAPEERLSDHVYKYTCVTKSFEML